MCTFKRYKKMSSFLEQCGDVSSSFTLLPGRRPLCSHTSSTEARQTVRPVLSQLCTLASGVAQNFATSCELIRHIFSSFWEDHTSLMSTSLTQWRPCKTVPLHSEHIWQTPMLWCSFITVNEKRWFARFKYLCRLHTSFIHRSSRRGRGLGRLVARSRQSGLNKFFLLETPSNKSFPTSPMNTLAARLID